MRILILQTAFLGDVVLTLPLIAAVGQQFPQAKVEVLTLPAHAPVLRDQPGVDAVITYDKRGTQRGLSGLLRMVRRLRARHYDLALSPHRSFRSAVLLAGSGIPRRIGFTRPLTRWAYTSTVSRPAMVHEVERNLQLLAACNVFPGPRTGQLSLHLAPAARQQARMDFGRHGVAPGDRLVGVLPGSQWGTKRWPAERFAELIRVLRQQADIHVALFGGPQDLGIAHTIASRCRVSVIDLVGRIPLQALAAHLDCCSVVVSNDTGPMHIAAALGKPIVVLYGPTTPALGFFPYGVAWEEASVALACRPCHAHGPQRCPKSHWRCMMDLSVDQVAARVQRLLGAAVAKSEG
ncbi:ADP-heptose--LPS heptosyltransferase 2 [Candidatus Entotheonellaceae bacterium PAL068K]